MRSTSSNLAPRARRTASSVTAAAVGEPRRIAAAASAQNGDASASSAVSMDGTEGSEKHASMASACARAAEAPGGSIRKLWSVAPTASANAAGGWPPSSAASASQISSMDDDATQCVASPRATTSAASNRAPVSAAYSPARPGVDANAREAPTSGKRPMATSGLCANQPESRRTTATFDLCTVSDIAN